MYTSLVFNEVVGLHVHNQQEYKLVVDHEFLDCFRWQWSLHAMVLHIGSTREEGHFVVYVVFNDKWWLRDDTTVKVMTPPPNPRKATFLVYKRKQTDLVVPPDMSQSASQRTGPPALGQTRDAQSIPIDTSVPAMALTPGVPPPLLQHRVHQGLGTEAGLCMPRACLWTPLCQPWRWHEVHPPLSQLPHRVHQG